MIIRCNCKEICGDVTQADDHPQAVCKITLGEAVPTLPKTMVQKLEEKLEDAENIIEKLREEKRRNEPRDFSYFGLGDGPT